VRGSIAPCIFDQALHDLTMVKVTPQHTYPWVKSHWYPLGGGGWGACLGTRTGLDNTENRQIFHLNGNKTTIPVLQTAALSLHLLSYSAEYSNILHSHIKSSIQ
jgi:hypothetical protein